MSAPQPAKGSPQQLVVSQRQRSHTEPSRARRRDHPRDNTLPSISIESDTSLELTPDLVTREQEVEPCDALLARAAGSNNTGVGVIIFQSDDESIDGDTGGLLMDSMEQTMEGSREEEGTDQVDGGPQPSDSVSVEYVLCINCSLFVPANSGGDYSKEFRHWGHVPTECSGKNDSTGEVTGGQLL